MRNNRLLWIALLLWFAASAVLSALFMVTEGQQALVVRLGAPLGVIATPGLKTKLPFIDTAIIFDTRLQLLTPPTEQIILGDQKRLEVKSYARFRIIDPLLFYQSVHTIDQAQGQLAQLVGSSIRRELGQVTLLSLLTDAREQSIAKIQKEVADEARPLGIEVTEVRIHRADLPAETSQAIYDRMKSERQREAKELRAQGFEWAQQIQAKADQDRTILLAEAQRDSTITRGQGDGEANSILTESFGKDRQFYTFYRSLQSYRQSLSAANPTLVLSPDADFLHVLVAGPSAATTAPDGK